MIAHGCCRCVLAVRSAAGALVLVGSLLVASIVVTGCGSGAAAAAGTPGSTVITVSVAGAAQTRLGSSTQFAATVTNTSNTAVTWLVNGVAGGAASTGTITASGLYVAPAAIPAGGSVTVTAASAASATASASVAEAIWNPVPVLSSASITQTNATSYLLDVRGSSFVQGAQILVGGAPAATAYVNASEVQATITPASGATTLAVSVMNPNPGAVASASTNVTITVMQASIAAASRLLDQATFGPTLNDIQHVQAVGLDGYLTEQFNLAPTLMTQLPAALPVRCAPNTPRVCFEDEWWHVVLNGHDQLRQRVAFALSEMFVVSQNSTSTYAVLPYANLLATDAFGNFQTLMKDVTLSVAMGNYLDMLQSAKPAAGQIANENYAREFMQLFTIGLNQLHPDGTMKLDASGNPIPTFTQNQVQAFARAYTGWTYANATGGMPSHFPNTTPSFNFPMVAFDSAHDMTPKALLGGTTLPGGQGARQDLDQAIANLFVQENVGPFVGRQLIQHLVTSNPSPAYVGRVAAVFGDNGKGVRGDLQAVVRAILMDPEARAGDTDPNHNGGHLREPILYVANVMRGLGYANNQPDDFYYSLSNESGVLGQRPYESGSVFNFFPPSYVVPGSVNAPEFALENTASAILRLSVANAFVSNQVPYFTIDLSATSALGLMAANPANLVDSLGTMFMHGQMPADMRTAIIDHITPLTSNAERARVAAYLVITSSQYKILH